MDTEIKNTISFTITEKIDIYLDVNIISFNKSFCVQGTGVYHCLEGGDSVFVFLSNETKIPSHCPAPTTHAIFIAAALFNIDFLPLYALVRSLSIKKHHL